MEMRMVQPSEPMAPGLQPPDLQARTAWLTNRFRRVASLPRALAFSVLALSACATAEPVGGPLTIEVAAPSPRAALTRIASGAAKCWTEGAIADYSVIPELDTGAGTPRLLVVEKGQGRGLPQLVIEGTGSPTRLRSYGPLATASLSGRINSDIIRWSTGPLSCGGRA